MATIADQLTQLQADKEALVNFLVDNEIEATNDDTFTTLIPKLQDIKGSGSEDSSEYFNNTISNGYSSVPGWAKTIKKLPTFVMEGTSCSYMFYQYQGTELDLSNFDTSQVTTFEYAFASMPNIKVLNLNNLNTSKVKNFSNTFAYTYVEELYINDWDVSSATTLSRLCAGMNKLKTIDLSSWNVEHVTNIGNMFYSCDSLMEIDIRTFDFNKITGVTSIFHGVPVNCEIIVKDDYAKQVVLTERPDFTNVKTVAELEA